MFDNMTEIVGYAMHEDRLRQTRRMCGARK